MKCHGSGGTQPLTLGRIIGSAKYQLDSAWEWLIHWVTDTVLLCRPVLASPDNGGIWRLRTRWLEWGFITHVLLGQRCLRSLVEARQQMPWGLDHRRTTMRWRSGLHQNVKVTSELLLRNFFAYDRKPEYNFNSIKSQVCRERQNPGNWHAYSTLFMLLYLNPF